MEIMTFKLLSGEEIIAKVTNIIREGSVITGDEGDVTHYELEQPMLLMLAELAKGQVVPMPVAPWILLAKTDDVVSLDVAHVVHIAENIPKQIEDHYIQTISPIALV